MPESFSPLLAGRYTLVEQIGNGNMSKVYRGEDTRRGNQIVAVKLLTTDHADALKEEFFRRETKALERLEHPHIIKISDYGWSKEYRCHYREPKRIKYPVKQTDSQKSSQTIAQDRSSAPSAFPPQPWPFWSTERRSDRRS